MNPIKILAYLYYWKKRDEDSSFSGLMMVCAVLALHFLTLVVLVDALCMKCGYIGFYENFSSESTFVGRKLSSWLICGLLILATLIFYFFNRLKINKWMLEFQSLDKRDRKVWNRRAGFYVVFSFILWVLSMVLAV